MDGNRINLKLIVINLGFRTVNLMDHVFAILEQHASTLEEEVEERTKELVEEKKKSDVLLYRMLPRYCISKEALKCRQQSMGLVRTIRHLSANNLRFC